MIWDITTTLSVVNVTKVILCFSQPQQLLIEMEDWDGNTTQVAVNNFIIGTEFYKSVDMSVWLSRRPWWPICFNKIILGSGLSMETSMVSLAKVCLRKGRSSAQLTETTTLGARIVPEGFSVQTEKRKYWLFVWLQVWGSLVVQRLS